VQEFIETNGDQTGKYQVCW